jgi:hypothetical protein
VPVASLLSSIALYCIAVRTVKFPRDPAGSSSQMVCRTKPGLLSKTQSLFFCHLDLCLPILFSIIVVLFYFLGKPYCIHAESFFFSIIPEQSAFSVIFFCTVLMMVHHIGGYRRFGLFLSYALKYKDRVLSGEALSCTSGLRLPKQLSLHNKYLHCNYTRINVKILNNVYSSYSEN